MTTRLFTFMGGAIAPKGGWSLRGITRYDRYVERAEKQALVSVQEGLGRPLATFAALIPIRKSATWWALTQDEHEVDIRLVKNDI